MMSVNSMAKDSGKIELNYMKSDGRLFVDCEHLVKAIKSVEMPEAQFTAGFLMKIFTDALDQVHEIDEKDNEIAKAIAKEKGGTKKAPKEPGN